MNNRYREEEKENEKESAPTEEKQTPEANTPEANPEPAKEPEFIEKNADQEKIQELEEEVRKLKDQYLRVLADAENYKKRINDERIRERKYSAQSLCEKLVGTLDIFDKVLSMKTDDEKLKNFLSGFSMINESFKKILEDEGVKKIVSLHQKFDPIYHHAVEVEWDEKQEEGTIIEEFQTGYLFKDRVLRAAMVKVNKKNKEETK